jgi:biopolymer transport protein ExbD
MASLPSPRSTKHRPRLEIIPFIDIMFFLLATFMMVSLSMVQNQGIDVRLPLASTSQAQNRTDESVTITVSQNGEYFYNKEPASLEQIIGHLQLLTSSRPDPQLFLNGDAKADFENVVAVLDEARKLGVRKIAIETTKKP